jgi:DNA-binding SARP family transcriptional activator
MASIDPGPGQSLGSSSCRAKGAPPDDAWRARPLQLSLLGGFTLLAGAEEIVLPMSAQRLVALLALRDRPLSRTYLAGVLWSEYSAKRSMADLRTALWRANQSGAPVISVLGLRLHLAADVQVDTRTLMDFGCASPGKPGGAIQALARTSWFDLSMDLLPDWYDDWLIDDRESVRQLRLHALESLAAEFSQLGRHAEAIQAALAAVRLEPLRETAHGALIKAHLAEGNRSEALRQFSRCRDMLAAELAVEPSAAIRQLIADAPAYSTAGLAR